jgi:hypothetical protein
LAGTLRPICLFLLRLGVSTASGRPIRWRNLRRWITDHGFPVLPGGRYKLWQQAPVTSEFAVMAWIPSREQNGKPMRILTRRPAALAGNEAANGPAPDPSRS